MNQLPHGPVCEPEFRGDLDLRESLDEDGAKCLVSAMVGGGIGIQEEQPAAGVVHVRTSRCEEISGDFSSQVLYQNPSAGPSPRPLGLKNRKTTPALMRHPVG
jgi:hypothetical protein